MPTPFQLAMLGLFVVALIVNYWAQLRQMFSRFVSASHTDTVPPVNPVKPTTAYTVQDLVTIAELRDRLSRAGCNEGVEACKMLLRVMIEFKLP